MRGGRLLGEGRGLPWAVKGEQTAVISQRTQKPNKPKTDRLELDEKEQD